MRRLPAAVRQAAPWKNGGGVTREVASVRSANGEAFRWRVSIAEVTKEGPFSSFAGFRRLICVIDGRGMQLNDAARGAVLLHPFQPHEFDGAAEVYGALPSGPVSDFNVIFRPGEVEASLRFSDRGEQLLVRARATVLVVNVEKRPATCTVGDQTIELAPLDALELEAGELLRLPPGHRCAVVELTPG